jgi:tetratricopeptide (TPR) repeat protein
VTDGRQVLILESAVRAAQEGNNRDAIRLLESVLEPELDARFWGLLGDLYVEEEQYASAVDALQMAIRQDPSSSALFSALGRAYLAIGRLRDSEEAFQTSIRLKPTAARWVMLGDVQASRGRERLARQSFEHALALESNNDEALFNLALLLRSKEPRRAEALLDEVLTIDAEFAKAYRELGFIRLRRGEHTRAEEDLSRAMQLDPDDPWTSVYLAALAEAKGNVSDAQAHLERAREVAIMEGFPDYLLGDLLARGGRWAEAEAKYHDALQANRKDPEATFHFARFLSDCGRKGEARDWAERTLALDAGHEGAAELLGDLQCS